MTDTEAAQQAARTLADARKRRREIAPVPDPSAADPGPALGRYLAVTGLYRAALARDSHDDAEAARVAMAAAMLWRRLSAVDIGYAWAIAGQIATAWRDGDGTGEWLHTLAGQFGIDAAEVNGLAQFEALARSARQAEAEKGARQAIGLAVRDAIAGNFGDTINRITDETVGAKLAEVESAVRANERERIKGLFEEWITILMSEPNSHPPEAWIAGFADLISDKPKDGSGE